MTPFNLINISNVRNDPVYGRDMGFQEYSNKNQIQYADPREMMVYIHKYLNLEIDKTASSIVPIDIKPQSVDLCECTASFAVRYRTVHDFLPLNKNAIVDFLNKHLKNNAKKIIDDTKDGTLNYR